ncbi:snurportin-1 [Maniola hyperantus]|uniref:snurportin-1 n=1 Tax=Aphantopus hyperantus TaxID=2795564 RepID=UPI0015691E45|nr:snurportin-1 [Maniola hyperantus]
MEDDLEILEKALSNLDATESKEEKSDFEGLYKNWGKTGSQEERRAQLLETQKGNRNSKIDRFRGILELVNAVEDNSKLFKPYKKVPYRPNIYVAGFHKTCLTYSNVLMLSEWMIEKPSDFAQNWYVVPCPKGVRVLVVANNGNTKFYTKYGHFKFDRYTGLPGGNPYNFYRKNCCVLDCFYHEQSNTLHLLDLLAWNNQPMTDGETEFRQYWMKTQLEDFPDTKTISKKNKVIIKILPMMPCTTHYISYLLSTYPLFENNVPPLDGLLFYHKRAHYVAGETPLVGWLFPYMVPEVLGEDITMHPGYIAEKPADYVNQADFIQKFEAKFAKKNKRRSSSAMETDSTKGSTKDLTQMGKSEKNKAVETNDKNAAAKTDEINENKTMETDNSNSGEKREEKEDKVIEIDNKEGEQKSREEKKSKNTSKSEEKAARSVSMDADEEKTDAAELVNK